MQKFYTTTLESQFILNLLTNTPLPIFNTVRDGDFIIKSRYYVYRHEIILCTKSGYIMKDNILPLFPSNTLFPNEELFPSDASIAAKWDVILRYEFGQYYPKITSLYRAKTNYYDSDTHARLGKYLRCLRDIYDIDYMPFYNCYNAKNLTDIILGNPVKEKNNTQSLIAIPVLYNKNYTYCINTRDVVSMQYLKYGQHYLKDNGNDKIITSRIVSDIGDEEESIIDTFKNIGTPHKATLSYTGLYTASAKEVLWEKFLYLCFLAKEIKGLAVLEGRYTQAETKAVNYVDTSISPHITSKLSLYENIDDFYAFSDRLVEGLLNNIINSQEEIYYNIGAVQKAIGKPANNIWDDKIKLKLFNEYLADQKVKAENKFDITGDIDKDIEFWLFKGMN